MKKIFYLLLSAVSGILLCGCKEEQRTPHPAQEAVLQIVVRCPACKWTGQIRETERPGQGLGRCPNCKKVFPLMRARVKK
ncbi:MAG: hypothetical protein J6S58_07190 [Lentisphaeria bacterium]|nr:hypothetical protein [Lentisphaeria bacterium]